MYGKTILFLLLIAAAATVSAESIRFAKFKFQPNSKYRITLTQKGEMITSSSNQSGQALGTKEGFGNLEQSLKLSIDITTHELGKENVMPLEMSFHDLKMEVTSGGEKLPMDVPQLELSEKEHHGELNENGEINVTGGSSRTSSLQAKGIDPVQILQIIPDFPEKDFKVGNSFDVLANHAAGSAIKGRAEGYINYKIIKIDGDDVLIETKMNSKSSDSSGGVERESTIGSTGLIIYSLKDKICRSIKVDIVVNTTMGSKGSKPSSVIINKMHLDVAIESVK